MQFTEKDAALIIKIVRSVDTLKVVFQNLVPMKDRRAYSQQFQAELMSLFREYGVYSFEGTYQRK
jgi:hypothetical protein